MESPKSVFWQAVAYEGEFEGHGPLQSFSWAAHGSSEYTLEKDAERDETTICLLSMRMLLERLLQGELRAANRSVGVLMTIVVECFPTKSLEFGKVVARLDTHRVNDTVVASTLTIPGLPPRSLEPVVLGREEGAWELVIRMLAHL
jgi:hypothetical protein